jgi:hypothetical protein
VTRLEAYDLTMAKDYKQSANDARDRSDQARASSDRHSNKLTQMKRHAHEAGSRLKDAAGRQRKHRAKKQQPMP